MILIVGAPIRILVRVDQPHTECTVGTGLRGTPEERGRGSSVVIGKVVSVATRLSRKAEVIRSILAVHTPRKRTSESPRLENRACSRLAAHCREQGNPLRCIWQVPATGANSIHSIRQGTAQAIATINQLIRIELCRIDCSLPRVKASCIIAMLDFIAVVAPRPICLITRSNWA